MGADGGGILSGLSGVMNTVVGNVTTRSVGVADVQTVGVSEVVHVGETYLTDVGNYHKITVGEEFVTEVGEAKFTMKQDGSVLILGTSFDFTSTGPVQLNGKPIDMN